MKLVQVLFLSTLLVQLPLFQARADDKAQQQAIGAAEHFLGLVDGGACGESWEVCDTLLKNAVGREQWVQSLKGLRTPLGRVLIRELVASEFKTELPGAPDGQYLVLVYATRFVNKERAQETVTPMLEEDGVWRVAGYYIR